MSIFSEEVKDYALTVRGFLKWLLIAVAVGVPVGIIGASFHHLIDIATEIRTEHRAIIWLLPLGGLAIAGLYKIFGLENDKGTNTVIESVQDSNLHLRFKNLFLIFVSSVITHLFGGSSGREGAALQIGGSFSSELGRLLRLDKKDRRIIMMCGMAAGFSALFGTPVTATVFALEVASVGVINYAAMPPCMVASVVGWATSSMLGTAPAAYDLSGIPKPGPFLLCKILGLTILGALLSILFCYVMSRTSKLYKKFFKNQFIRAVVGGFAVALISFLLKTDDYNGVGGQVIANAFIGISRPEAFILKMILTALTLGAGYKGGEIVPVMFVGATFGNVVSPFFGLSRSFGAGLGLISVFTGVTNCPLASMILSIELFGAEALPYFALSCGVSYMLSGYFGLYSSQRIVYSKAKSFFIDRYVGGHKKS